MSFDNAFPTFMLYAIGRTPKKATWFCWRKSSSKNAGESDPAFIPSSIPYGRRILPFRGLAFSNFLVLGSATRGFEAVPLLCKLCVDVVVCLVRDCLRLVLVVVVEAEDSVSSFTRSPLWSSLLDEEEEEEEKEKETEVEWEGWVVMTSLARVVDSLSGSSVVSPLSAL